MEETALAANTTSYMIGIVDDDGNVRAAMSGLLRSQGYAVQAFESAMALLASASLPQLDCIVSDVQMPVMNGLEMQDALRRAGYRTPLVMITAFPHPHMHRRALAGGANCFLSKQVLPQELLDSIAAALGT